LAKSFGIGTAKELTNNAWDAAATDGTLTSNILLTSSPFVAATGFQGAANGTDKLLSTIESADFKLASGSSCIDAGNNAYVTSTVTRDLANSERIQNSIVDMGCYESSFTTLDVKMPIAGGLKVIGNKIQLPESAMGQTVCVFNVNGMEVKNYIANSFELTIAGKGVYVVKVNNEVYKVIL
jgi:hypothetical protein